MSSKNILLQFRDADGFETFSNREYETMKEARKDLKELAKDKSYFNHKTETPDGYKSCVEIRLIVNGEIIECKATAWAAEILKKYEDLADPEGIKATAAVSANPDELPIGFTSDKGTYIPVASLDKHLRKYYHKSNDNDISVASDANNALIDLLLIDINRLGH
jgi:hypothetical protein